MFAFNKIDKKTVVFIIVIFVLLLLVLGFNETMVSEPTVQTPSFLSDKLNESAWGTTLEDKRRWENLSLRPEYQGDLKDGTYKQGAEGHTHSCPCGPPSKRTIEANGGHHQLQHMCEPCTPGQTEPVQLGTWWTRDGCGDPTSVGLSQRPYCTDC